MEKMFAASGWRKSTRCETSACVEVAPINGGAGMRDGKQRLSPVLLFDARAWTDFIDAVKSDQFTE